MGVSKVVYNGDTLIDLTSDTVAADKLLSGYTAHAANGEKLTGTYVPSTEPIDLNNLQVVETRSNQTASRTITTKPNNLIVFGYTVSGTTNRDLTNYITGATLISQFTYRTDNPYTKTGLFVTTGTSVTFTNPTGRYGYAYYELP